MRVIAGAAGGRPLLAPPGRGTRPTSDRLKQALFNILGDAVPDADVLDLYAGSGALGIEALSRGARSATFVERDPRAARILRANLDRCGYPPGAAAVRIIVADVAAACQRLVLEAASADAAPAPAPVPPAAPAAADPACTLPPPSAAHPAGAMAPMPAAPPAPPAPAALPARAAPPAPLAPPAPAAPPAPPAPAAPTDLVCTSPPPSTQRPAPGRAQAPPARPAPGYPAAQPPRPASAATMRPAPPADPRAAARAHPRPLPPPARVADSFALVLADPPYETGDAARLLALLAGAAAPLLGPAGALVAIEHACGEEMPDAAGNLRLMRRPAQGRGCVSLYAAAPERP